MNPILESLSLLTPYDIDRPKVRIGPKGDGGYVFVDILEPSQSILSYGIGGESRFDQEMALRGHKVHMFDHTIPGVRITHPNMNFYREGVAGSSKASESLFSIEDHLRRYQIGGDDMILKMDVEGAEWEAIGHSSSQTLRRFSQIVIEIHELDKLLDQAFREMFNRFCRKLNSLFTLFHVHANNHDGPNGIVIVNGLPVSPLLELSYVRRDLCRNFPSQTLYPTVYDYPNVNRKDKLLWFYPFMPTTRSREDFLLCDERAELFHLFRNRQ